MIARRSFVRIAGYGFAWAASRQSSFAGVYAPVDYDVRKFGAIGDGVALDTAAVQRAVDAATAAGGGRVLLPGGRKFLTGCLMLKSGVELHMADDSR